MRFFSIRNLFLACCCMACLHGLSARMLNNTYLSKETGVSSEIREITQSPNGDMLFVSDRSITQFDGNEWKIFQEGVDFSKAVSYDDNSFYYSQHGDTYKAIWDSKGKITHTELSANVSVDEWEFMGIEAIFEHETNVLVFNNFQMLNIAPDLSYQFYPLGCWVSTVVECEEQILFFEATDVPHVYTIDPDSGEISQADSRFQHEKLLRVASACKGFDEDWWLFTAGDDIFHLNSDGIELFCDLPEDTYLMSMAIDSSGNLIMGTQKKGIYFFNQEGECYYHLDESNGLLSNRTNKLFVDDQGILWVAMSQSIQSFLLKDGIEVFDEQSGLQGNVLCIERFDDDLYVGTELGLFVKDDHDKFQKIPGFSRIRWMDSDDQELILLDGIHLYAFDGITITRIHENEVHHPYLSKAHPRWLLCDSGREIVALKKENNKWSEFAISGEKTGRPYGFGEDGNGSIWAVIGAGHCARFKIDGNEVMAESFDASNGVPNRWVQPFMIEGECYLGVPDVLKWNEQTYQFEPSPARHFYEGWIPFGYEQVFSQSGSDKVWVAAGLNNGNLVKRPDAMSISVVVIDGLNIDTRARALFWDDNDIAWIGSKNLIRFSESAFRDDLDSSIPVTIDHIKTIDGKHYLGAGSEFPDPLVIDYEQRSFIVTASHKNFQSMGFVRFSMELDGIEIESQDWGHKHTWEFTHLDPGTYTLTIWAHDATGKKPEPCVVTFLVKPPFYFSVTAWVVYGIAAILGVLGFTKLRLLHLSQTNQQLERAVIKRTQKIASQSEQLKQQNQELNSAKKESDRLAEVAQAAVKSKSRFLANMSHEIRTPMNGVIGMNMMLRDTELTLEQRRFVDTIDRCGNNLLSIINDILLFSKTESEGIELESMTFDIRELVSEIIEIFPLNAKEKKIEIVVNIDSQMQGFRTGDADKLKHVLINLVSNAVKFTDDGEVCVRVYPTNADPDVLTFEISDTGIGIDELSLDELFKPFTQADGSITRRFGGSGLGLAISERYVELMGSKITCESKLGVGSVFAFDLKLPRYEHHFDRKIEDAYDSVFWVDSNEERRNWVESELKSVGVKGTVVASPDELEPDCIQSLENTLVVVDIDAMKGDRWRFEMLETSLCMDEHSDLVVLCKANGEEVPVELSKQVYLRVLKPVTPTEFQQLVSRSIYPQSASLNSTVSNPALEELNVLVVDDDRLNRKVTLMVLSKFGIVADFVHSGEDAIAAVKHANYHLILLDLQMPGMDGFATAQNINEYQQHQNHSSTIVALTAGVAEWSNNTVKAKGMDGLIPKPIRLEDFEKLFEWLIKHHELTVPNGDESSPPRDRNWN